MKIYVRNGYGDPVSNVERALRALKREMQREGVFKDMRKKEFHEKPGEKRRRKSDEARKRARKNAKSQS